MIYHAKSGSYYALIVPDLTRSYSISADIDINSASRLNIKMRIHVRPTRLENERITASNLPWQVALAFTSILSFMTALVNIIEKDVVVEVVKEVEKPQK